MGKKCSKMRSLYIPSLCVEQKNWWYIITYVYSYKEIRHSEKYFRKVDRRREEHGTQFPRGENLNRWRDPKFADFKHEVDLLQDGDVVLLDQVHPDCQSHDEDPLGQKAVELEPILQNVFAFRNQWCVVHCDLMTRLFFSFWPFASLKICPMTYKFCQDGFRRMPNTK